MVFGRTRRDKGKKQVVLAAKDYVAANVPRVQNGIEVDVELLRRLGLMMTRKSSRKKNIKYAKIQELWSSFDVRPS